MLNNDICSEHILRLSNIIIDIHNANEKDVFYGKSYFDSIVSDRLKKGSSLNKVNEFLKDYDIVVEEYDPRLYIIKSLIGGNNEKKYSVL